ncbi:MAG TPA: phosphopentomutase [Caldisericia bacterium]|nr:phosphopentomutase [Caldisericia bacterium]HPF48324.1 phosphopentomutase [Caldisericia bacterium]HPI83497.1 phosphopentomutase [Caldisericia bacterium]HPQ92777.1 phosphopentomutase [Caldisericia bacterium]HRV74125.1 phosphopentomutase [Caldisericia bacterium]
MKRSCVLVVLDGLGVGETEDTQIYGDTGANTLKHATDAGELELKNLSRFGLYNLIGANADCIASWTDISPKSSGKSTVEGHWEMMGVILDESLPTYPDGFSEELLGELSWRIARPVLCGKPGSGTKIIEEYGDEHMLTGYPIVYTSADSVMQIAAHEDVIPVTELYEICYIARHLMTAKDNVARIIARPFIGEPGNFTRTSRRKDFTLNMPVPNNLLSLLKAKVPISCVGRTADLFENYASRAENPYELEDAINQTMTFRTIRNGFIFLNLGSFDSLYGHRRDKEGFARELQRLDAVWTNLYKSIGNNDLLLVASDHGNDPTFQSHTDHTREKTFVMAYTKGYKGHKLHSVEMVDIGATICDYFGVTPCAGKSFLEQVKSEKK